MSIAQTRTAAPAWRQLLGYVRPHRWSLFAGALLSLVTGATGLLLPLVARELIDDLSHDRAIWLRAARIRAALSHAPPSADVRKEAEDR